MLYKSRIRIAVGYTDIRLSISINIRRLRHSIHKMSDHTIKCHC